MSCSINHKVCPSGSYIAMLLSEDFHLPSIFPSICYVVSDGYVSHLIDSLRHFPVSLVIGDTGLIMFVVPKLFVAPQMATLIIVTNMLKTQSFHFILKRSSHQTILSAKLILSCGLMTIYRVTTTL